MNLANPCCMNKFDTSMPNLTLKGQVVDQFGDYVPNANIVVAGTAHGTMADFEGHFVLPDVDFGDIIHFSYAGKVTKFPAQKAQGIVVLDIESLDEVTVNGSIKKDKTLQYAGIGLAVLVAAVLIGGSNKKTVKAKI